MVRVLHSLLQVAPQGDPVEEAEKTRGEWPAKRGGQISLQHLFGNVLLTLANKKVTLAPVIASFSPQFEKYSPMICTCVLLFQRHQRILGETIASKG